jgi:hypothetical protein
MVIRLLPAPVDRSASTDAAAVSASVAAATLAAANPVIVTTRVITRNNIAYVGDSYVRSASAGRDATGRFSTTPPQSSWTGATRGEDVADDAGEPSYVSTYVPGSSWNASGARSVAAHYLTYAAISDGENGQLLDVYA